MKLGLSIGYSRAHLDIPVELVQRYQPGDQVSATIVRDGRTATKELILSAPQVFDYRIEEIPNASVTAKALRAAWLSGR